MKGIEDARAVGMLDVREAEPDERPDRHGDAWGAGVRVVVDVPLGDIDPPRVSPFGQTSPRPKRGHRVSDAARLWRRCV